MKLSTMAGLVAVCLVLGCAGMMPKIENPSTYTLNGKTITLGMSQAEVKEAFGPPLNVRVPATEQKGLAEMMLASKEQSSETHRMNEGKTLWYYIGCKMVNKADKEELIITFVGGSITEIMHSVWPN